MYAKLEEEKLLQSKQEATNKTTYLRIHTTHKSQNQATRVSKNPEKSETRPEFFGFSEV